MDSNRVEFEKMQEQLCSKPSARNRIFVPPPLSLKFNSSPLYRRHIHQIPKQ